MAPIRNDAVTRATPASGPGTLSPFVPPAEAHPDRGTGEPERLAQLVLEVPTVGKMDLRGIVHEENERRRRYVRLGRVVELEPFPGLARRWVRRDGLFQHLVQG